MTSYPAPKSPSPPSGPPLATPCVLGPNSRPRQCRQLGAKLADVADWMYYAVGKVFDTRVDAPVCDSEPPSWVREVVFIEDNRNNPIRFCSGRDGKKPNLLVVKARVNRGFAFAAKPAVKTAWQYNSSEATGLWDAVLPWLRANDEALRDTLLQVTGGDPRLAVGAGQELSLGLAEKDVRAVKDLHRAGAATARRSAVPVLALGPTDHPRHRLEGHGGAHHRPGHQQLPHISLRGVSAPTPSRSPPRSWYACSPRARPSPN